MPLATISKGVAWLGCTAIMAAGAIGVISTLTKDTAALYGYVVCHKREFKFRTRSVGEEGSYWDVGVAVGARRRVGVGAGGGGRGEGGRGKAYGRVGGFEFEPGGPCSGSQTTHFFFLAAPCLSVGLPADASGGYVVWVWACVGGFLRGP